MFGYYLALALRSLRQNAALSVLMVVVMAVGIGACTTMLTIFRAMAADPIPGRSAQLFTVQIDNHGPDVPNAFKGHDSDQLPLALTYLDAMALMRAHAAVRQAAMYATSAALTPSDPRQLPFKLEVRATYTDFFSMFAVPFQYGAPWSASDDQARMPVIVIARHLNDRLFGGADSVGSSLILGTQSYRIVGVIDNWRPRPRFYDLGFGGGFSPPAQIYVPFTVAVKNGFPQDHYMRCLKSPDGHLLTSECEWVQFWAQLPPTAAVRAYRSFLHNYVAAQRRSGRFDWPPRFALRNVRQWLDYNHVVSGEVSLLSLVSFAFLLVCLLNAAALMLAKFMRRGAQLQIRRALGANRAAIAAQSLVEAGVVGVVGALAGLGLSLVGLAASRGLFSSGEAGLTQLDSGDVAVALVLGISATLVAGLYPTWRAARAPGWHLKEQ